MLTLKKERISAIANAIVELFLLINAILTAMGKDPIPFDATATTEMLTYIVTIVWSMWVWWRNNNVTRAAVAGQVTTNTEKELGRKK